MVQELITESCGGVVFNGLQPLPAVALQEHVDGSVSGE